MTNLTELQNLVDRFHANIDFYKDARNAYNEHSCRIEYAIHDRVVAASREIYEINDALSGRPAKRIANLLQRQKETLISEIQGLIDRVYRLDY